MAEPTIYDLILDLIRHILMPLILCYLVYHFGTKTINEYQRKKDENSKRELIIREAANYHTQAISFLKMCLDVHEGRREMIKTSIENVLITSIIEGLAKVYFNTENHETFTTILDKYASIQLEIMKNNFAISADQYRMYVKTVTEYYYELLDFVKKTEINP